MSNPDLVARAKSAFKHMAKSVYILSASAEGRRHATVSTAICNVSNDPPSLLICMEKTASFSQLLAPGTGFAVNILGAGQRAVVDHCMSASGEARFEVGEWTTLGGQPALSGAQATFIARVNTIESYQTHNIVIADIEDSVYSEEHSALVYVNGTFVPLPAP